MAKLGRLLRMEARVVRAWLPVLLCIALILLFGSEEFSGRTTSRFIGPLLRWLFPDAPAQTIFRLHLLIRKAAHLGEFGLLALLTLRALRMSLEAPLLHVAARALALVLAVAALDETRQIFSSTRTGSAWDVGLDLVGGMLALGFAVAYLRVMGARRAAPEKG